ncbi:sulfur carrier protein ThiS [Campylobacter showae]|uniref:sulfur carrier protein ThiS n=1 Tax=Campylobacter showae TaxID=204 RepID=UPI0026F11166|nr:sulfur carrier protein ThiS [Campylobacter showae]
MLKINGKDGSEFIGKTVAQLLTAKGLKPERIAVELNGEILPKDKFDTALRDGDSAEIVHFVGGG